MHKLYYKTFIILSLIVFINTTTTAQSQRNCATTDYTINQIAKNPDLRAILEQQEIDIENYLKNAPKDNSVITIPIVFHVLYNNTITNISDEQIYSQLQVLNEDYSRLNSDTSSTPDMFKSVAASPSIQFCMARQDPDGNWTNGITRTSVTNSSYDADQDDAKYDSKGGKDAWNTTLYFNVWIVPEITASGLSGILGYAQFPGGNTSTDGVVVAYKYFGTTGTASYPFDGGRTLTHETGHYLNLSHIWGDAYNCSGTDNVDDTPKQTSENYNCPTHPSASCNNGGDMFQNYMDYTNDACMNLFTQGQADRMRAAINTSRASLITSTMCTPTAINNSDDKLEFNIYPNPAGKELRIQSIENSDNIEIEIIDMSGKTVFVNNYTNMETTTIINTSEFSDGIYFIKISNSEAIKMKKLIIQQ